MVPVGEHKAEAFRKRLSVLKPGMTKKGCHHSVLSSEAAQKILSEKGINRTRIKIRVLTVLSSSSRPLSVNELHKKLDGDCNVSTLFRTLTQFKAKELVREVNLDEGFFRYELAPQEHRHNHHHHHHVRCRLCGDIRTIEDCDLSQFEKAISRLGFTQMEHRLEFTGLCGRCS